MLLQRVEFTAMQEGEVILNLHNKLIEELVVGPALGGFISAVASSHIWPS